MDNHSSVILYISVIFGFLTILKEKSFKSILGKGKKSGKQLKPARSKLYIKINF